MAKKKIVLSPIPQEPTGMTFPDAVREMLNGQSVTRVTWNNQAEFGCIRNGNLTIHTRGDYHQWLVNDGDLYATDWIVVANGNS